MSKQDLTIEMVRESAFYQSRPKEIQDLIEKVPPTHEYLITETGHECTIYSYGEDGTVTVVREANDIDRMTGKIGPEIEYINVFGLKPDDLTIRLDKPIKVDEDDIKDEEMRIVKIQKSLSTSEEERQVLIYDEKKEFVYEGPLTFDVERLMGDRDKIYAEAMLTPDRDDEGNKLGTFKFSIVHVTEEQEW